MLLGLWTRRVGALAVAVLSVVFFAALASALLRGLTLDCGCFGTGAPSRPRMWQELGLDVVLFSGALLVYLRSIYPLIRALVVNAASIKAQKVSRRAAVRASRRSIPLLATYALPLLARP
jgi:hypothetical protein